MKRNTASIDDAPVVIGISLRSAPRILTARVRVFFSRVDIIAVRCVDRAVGESDACTRLLLRRTVKLEVRRKVRFGDAEIRRARF